MVTPDIHNNSFIMVSNGDMNRGNKNRISKHNKHAGPKMMNLYMHTHKA